MCYDIKIADFAHFVNIAENEVIKGQKTVITANFYKKARASKLAARTGVVEAEAVFATARRIRQPLFS